MERIRIKCRKWFKGQNPREIKLEVPGWSGTKTYDTGQPWHCKPFIDGSTYGLELVYPFDTEAKVTTKDGNLVFDADFSKEKGDYSWDIPFSSFAPNHFGFTSSIDIETPKGMGTMIMPHARFYTDTTGTVPVPVCGFLETDFWARIFFVVFKSPMEGQTYIFRKGEAYATLLFLKKKVEYEILDMTDEEVKNRSELEKIISESAKKIATRTWKTKNGEVFDNKYKILSKINKSGSVEEYLRKLKKPILVKRNVKRKNIQE